MDWVERKERVLEFLRKYRWAALVLLIGLILMAMPEGKKEEPLPVTQTAAQQEATLQQELEELLSRLDGAGKVKVLLSTAAGPETHYQTDEDRSQTADTQDRRITTVLVSGADRSQSGLVQRVDPPVYLGAVVLCQGADSASVRLAVVDTVGTATGLTSDKISVWKMK